MQFQPNNTNLFLIQHNFCGVDCISGGPISTCDNFSCNDCGKAAKFCVDCGGPATNSCSPK